MEESCKSESMFCLKQTAYMTSLLNSTLQNGLHIGVVGLSLHNLYLHNHNLQYPGGGYGASQSSIQPLSVS